MQTITTGSLTKNVSQLTTVEPLEVTSLSESLVETNVSQYTPSNTELQDLLNAKSYASDAAKSAAEAKASEEASKDIYDHVVDLTQNIDSNLDESNALAAEIRAISVKIDGQEDNVEVLAAQVSSDAASASASADIAYNEATQAEISQISANRSAQIAKDSADAVLLQVPVVASYASTAQTAATQAEQSYTKTVDVYNKTITDTGEIVKTFIKNMGSFQPNLGYPQPATWIDIFGVVNKYTCSWTASEAGSLDGKLFNEGDFLIYNAVTDSWHRFSGELLNGGGGGNVPVDFFSDIVIALPGKKLKGTDSNSQIVDLIYVSETSGDIIVGDVTKSAAIMSDTPDGTVIRVANVAQPSGYDEYKVYSEGFKPTADDVGAFGKLESDTRYLRKSTGGDVAGTISVTNGTFIVPSGEVYHPGNKPTPSALGVYSKAEADAKFLEANTDNVITGNLTVSGDLLSGTTDTTGTLSEQGVRVYSPNNKPSTSDLNVYSKTESDNKYLIKTGDAVLTGTLNVTTTLSEKGARVYSPNNKPLAIDIGALPITGGTITGALTVTGAATINSTLTLKAALKSDVPFAVTNTAGAAVSGYFGGLLVSNSYADATSIPGNGIYSKGAISSGLGYRLGTKNVITTSGTITTIGDNTEEINLSAVSGLAKVGTNRIYHEGFKPTAADIGAISLDTVYTKTESDARFYKTTDTVQNSYFTDWLNQKSRNAADFGSINGFTAFLNGTGSVGYPTEYGSGFFSSRQSNSLRYGFSLYKPSASTLLYFGNQIDDGSGFNWYKIYHEGFKPTWADVGGDLRIVDNGGHLQVGNSKYLRAAVGSTTGFLPNEAGTNANSKSYLGTEGWWFNQAWVNNYRGGDIQVSQTVRAGIAHKAVIGASSISDEYLFGGFSNNSTSFSSYLRVASGGLKYSPDGSTQYKVYHENNKPTSSDVGALSLSGGTVTGTTRFSSMYRGLISGSTAGDLSGWPNATPNDANNYINRSRFGVEAGNNGLHIFADGALNARRFGIQAGHSSSAYANALGNLDLNPYGGNVFVNGQLVYHRGDFSVDVDESVNAVSKRTSQGGLRASGFTSPSSAVRVTLLPKGGAYTLPTGSNITGSIKIKLPRWKTATMIKVYVSVYNYASDTSFNAVLSGYDYNVDGLWYNCSAVITGSESTTNHPVYFGNDGTNACIWIGSVGTVWAHPKIVVDKVETGYTGGNSELWDSGWEVSIESSLGTVVRTISNTVIKPNAAIPPSDESPTPNTLIKRNSLGEAAVKGRLLLVNSSDTNVGTGTGYVDFVSSAGSSYGQIGDVDSTVNMSIKSANPFNVLTMDSNAQKINSGGLLTSNSYADATKVPSYGIYSKGTISTESELVASSNSNSFRGLNIQNAGNGWSYIQLKAGSTVGHIAQNSTAADGGIASSLHLRPNGVYDGSLVLQPATAMKHQTSSGWISIGSLNASWAHINTDRPAFYFYKPITVAGHLTVPYDSIDNMSTTYAEMTSKVTPLVVSGTYNVGTSARFISLAKMAARHSGGYITHLNLGLYKDPNAWGEGVTGMYVALGGSDAAPTEHFTLAYGGKIKHSKGHEFYSTAFKPNSTDVGLSAVSNDLQMRDNVGSITTQDWNTLSISGGSTVANWSGANGPTGSYKYGTMLNVGPYGSPHRAQIYFPHNTTSPDSVSYLPKFRSSFNSIGSSAWRTLATTEYTDNTYLSNSGGVLSGELTVNARVKLGSVNGGSSIGIIKNQSGNGGESWLTAISDSISNHSAIGVSQNNGPQCWINGSMYRIYHQGFKPTPAEIGTVPINGDQTAQNGFLNFIATNYALGNCMYRDIDFASGSNSVSVYNNTSGSGVTHTWETNSLAPNVSKKVIKIVHTPSAGTSPGFGGFITSMASAANKIFVQVFVAKLDSGREWVTAENPMGTNSKTYWATSNKGTGKWERYVRVTMCGDSGSFSGGGHTYVAGGSSSTFTTYLAEATVYDITNIAAPYSKNNKPTADEIGAVPLSGGTMSGALSVPTGFIVGGTNVIGVYGGLARFGDLALTMNLNVKDGLLQVNNNGTYQRVYHQGFKPSASEIGALPIAGGTMTGNLHSSTGGIYPAANNASQLGNSSWWWNSAHITNVNSVNSLSSNGYTVNQTSGAGAGIHLYGTSTSTDPDYGLMFAQTSRFGTYGYVGGDWATYFNMTGASNRGWIFRNRGVGMAASISSDGSAHFNGQVRCGGWFRTTGNQGWFNETYSGGIYMEDTTWVRIYNGKKFLVTNTTSDSIYSYGGIGSSTGITANGTASGEGLAFNGKTAIGGVNDGWLRINPHSQFGSGIYCGITGALRHDANVQAGGWTGSVKASGMYANHYDSTWGVNGTAAHATNNPDSSGAHWLLGSYYDGSNIRSGIQVLSNSVGEMRLYTNRRSNYVSIQGGSLTAQNSVTASYLYGNGGGISNLNWNNITGKPADTNIWVTLYRGTPYVKKVNLNSAIINYLTSGNMVKFRVWLNRSGAADSERFFREVIVDGSDGWSGTQSYAPNDVTWAGVSYCWIRNAHASNRGVINCIDSQYTNIYRVDYQLM